MEGDLQNNRRSYDSNGFEQQQRQNKLINYLMDKQLDQIRQKRWKEILPQLRSLKSSGKEGQKKTINLVRYGVSDSLRHKPIYKYEECRGKSENKQINLDLQRTFPTHKQAKSIEAKLKLVLNALALALPEVGYCQGMNFIVGTLLLKLQQQDAFKVAYHIFHWQKLQLLLKDLHLIHEQLYALDRLIKKHYPKLFKLLQEHEVESIIYASSWFITLFCNSLPACFAFRIIESFLLEGEKILYRVALQILKWKKRELKSIGTVEGLIEELKNYDQFNEGNIDEFFKEMYEIPLSREEIKIYKEEYHKKSPKSAKSIKSRIK